MPILALLLAAGTVPPTPDCRAAQLRLSVDRAGGDFNGMSHSGVALSIRNVGHDCALPALPKVAFHDARGRPLPTIRRAPPGMHPGPVMVPVRLAGGDRAELTLRWVSGDVFSPGRSVRARSVTVQVGAGTLRVPLDATLYGAAGKAVTFDQTPARAMEGMAAG